MKKILVLNKQDDRAKLADILKSAGVRINYDSGGRALLLDISPDVEDHLKRLPFDVQIVDESDASKALTQPDDNENIFLRAISLRQTPAFKRKLEKFAPGLSPEEKELLSAPHYFGDDGHSL